MAKRKKKVTGVRKSMTKTQIYSYISDETGLTKKDVASVFDTLPEVIERHLKKGAVGQFTFPGLVKVKAVKRPARKAKKNVPNPFKPGEFMDIKARPASMRVKCYPLKKLKDMV